MVKNRKIVAYCRVSSQAQKPDLKNQREAIERYCLASAKSNVEYVEEVGGGLNFKRKKFLVLLDSLPELSEIIIAHKDRLARFGFDLLKHLCEKNNVELTVINIEKLSPEQEMVQDLMTIIHCFSSRLYGLRNYRKIVKDALSAK
jgi:predicted site-specific integrase-resolvase